MRFLSVILLLLLVKPVSADYTEAANYARNNRARMFVMFTASWCGPCQRLKQDVLIPLKEVLAKRYVIYHVDIDREPQVAEVYKRIGCFNGSVPTYVLIDNDFQVMGVGQGYKSIGDFVQWHNIVVERHDKN